MFLEVGKEDVHGVHGMQDVHHVPSGGGYKFDTRTAFKSKSKSKAKSNWITMSTSFDQLSEAGLGGIVKNESDANRSADCCVQLPNGSLKRYPSRIDRKKSRYLKHEIHSLFQGVYKSFKFITFYDEFVHFLHKV